MCDPVTMTVVAIGASGLAAYGQIQSANAAADAQEAQGKQLATQAGQQQDAANAEAERIRAAARRQRAEAAAAFASSGVSVADGTPLKIDQEIARGGELDALNTIISGGREADTLTNEAAAFGKQAKASRKAGQMQAVSTLMSGASSAATASGWRANGPGFSGGQKPAPIVNAR